MDYEPEIHPGAALRFSDLKANIRVFSTGSVTVTAPKTHLLQEGVLRAYKMVVLLCSFPIAFVEHISSEFSDDPFSFP